MTVNYNLIVATSRPWSLFKILFRWRGSLWKSVFLELSVWLACYAGISCIYRFALNEQQQIQFERFAKWCDDNLDYIPLNFMLGFFVTVIVNRWGVYFQNIGFIDNVALTVATYVKGSDERSRLMRRTIVRYCSLAQVLVYRDISMQVRKRFPTMETVVAGGFMLKHELERFEEIQYKYPKYWIPFQWAFDILAKARAEQKITIDLFLTKIIDEIKVYRLQLQTLTNYDWVPLPIMYPQLVCLAVHTYFVIALFSRQFIIRDTSEFKSYVDIYFPVMSALQFIFYMGWMKVAEALLNPLGEDDDDFECNFLLDRNLTMALTVVDEGFDRTPEMRVDDFWRTTVEPLYSTESALRTVHPLIGSTAHIELPSNVQNVTMISMKEEDEEDRKTSRGSTRQRCNIASKRISVDVKRSCQMDGKTVHPSLLQSIRRKLTRSKPDPLSCKHAYSLSGPPEFMATTSKVWPAGHPMASRCQSTCLPPEKTEKAPRVRLHSLQVPADMKDEPKSPTRSIAHEVINESDECASGSSRTSSSKSEFRFPPENGVKKRISPRELQYPVSSEMNAPPYSTQPDRPTSQQTERPGSADTEYTWCDNEWDGRADSRREPQED